MNCRGVRGVLELQASMGAVETYVADYKDASDAAAVTDLLNQYACDQFGNSAPLPDDILAKLVRVVLLLGRGHPVDN